MFEAEALAEAWPLTRGQPWLVNALAFEACFRRPEGWTNSTVIWRGWTWTRAGWSCSTNDPDNRRWISEPGAKTRSRQTDATSP